MKKTKKNECCEKSCCEKSCCGSKDEAIKSVALEDLVSLTVLAFCENLAELGCPKDEKDPDMWFRNLNDKKMRKVSEKLLTIIEKDY